MPWPSPGCLASWLSAAWAALWDEVVSHLQFFEKVATTLEVGLHGHSVAASICASSWASIAQAGSDTRLATSYTLPTRVVCHNKGGRFVIWCPYCSRCGVIAAAAARL